MQGAALAIVEPLTRAAAQTDRLARAVAGLLVRAGAARFRLAAADIMDPPRYPHDAAIARASAIYLLRVELGFGIEDTGALFSVDARRVADACKRIEDLRETDQALDHWLADLAAAVGACE